MVKILYNYDNKFFVIYILGGKEFRSKKIKFFRVLRVSILLRVICFFIMFTYMYL